VWTQLWINPSLSPVILRTNPLHPVDARNYKDLAHRRLLSTVPPTHTLSTGHFGASPRSQQLIHRIHSSY
jgi:hypothetical protein